ncbi:MAG: hypothetical protein AAGG07_09565 [Planctomycetota bacterium]
MPARPSPVPSSLRIPALVLCVGLMPGCGGPKLDERPDPPAYLLVESIPDDFAVSVTVYGPQPEGPSARSSRPGRYLFEPGGGLRAALGPGARESTLPPVVRTLRDAQQRAVWLAVRDSGLLEVDRAELIPSAAAYEATALSAAANGRTVAVFTVTALNDTRHAAVDLGPPDDPVRSLPAGSARVVIERLARLAWVR